MTGRQGSTRSIVFPPGTERPVNRKEPANLIETYSEVMREAALILKLLGGLLISANRHGDLQVVLTASKRLQKYVQELLEAEETHA